MGEHGYVERRPLEKEDGDWIVDSWKGIATYFGVTVRTVQIWERENGLPVHRQPGVRGRVFAHVRELEAWRSPQHAAGLAEQAVAPVPVRRISHRVASFAAATAVPVIVAAALFFAARPRESHPALHRFEGLFFVVLGENWTELWRRRLPAHPQPSTSDDPNTIPPLFADLDGDGKLEDLLAFQRFGSSFSDELRCYSASGSLLWTFHPGRYVHTAAASFTDHYRLRSLTLLPAEKGLRSRLLVNSRHEPTFPTQLVALDEKGRIQSEYWHSGHLLKTLIADLDHDGSSEILLAGISNGEKASSLLVLSAAGFTGTSQEENPAYRIRGMPPPTERARILFPRTRVSRLLDHYVIPTGLMLSGSQLRVDASDFTGVGLAPCLSCVFTRDLRFERIEAGDGAVAAYNALKAQKILPVALEPEPIESLRAVRYLTPFVPRSSQRAKAVPDRYKSPYHSAWLLSEDPVAA